MPRTFLPRGHPDREPAPNRRHDRPSESPSHPRPGFWKIRLAKGAVETVCCIRPVEEPEEDVWWEGNPNLAAYILDEPVAMDWVWTRQGEEIGEVEYRYQCALVAHCREHEPNDPLANPRRAVDLTKLEPIGPE
jgi:hypothetical protein